ncbi:MAG: peptidoglycan DD-metalloendopeptidase family protein [Methyloprofundus sp.]|nr:peptidoglycan DD-metalloendopeptidase family protein [Methyloprofundus sp.]
MAATNKNQELSQLQQQIKSLAHSQSELVKQQQAAQVELKKIEKQQGSIARSIQELDTQVTQKKQRIQGIQTDIQVQNGWLLMQQEKLAELVTAAHALGRQEQLKLLFNQQDSARTSRIMKYYQYFNQTKIEQLERIENSLFILKSLNQEHQAEQQRLTQLIKRNQKKKTDLAENKIQRQQILTKITQDSKTNSSQLVVLKKNETQLKQLINKLQQEIAKSQLVQSKTAKQNFKNLKGKLAWPVKGRIVRSYGSPRARGKWSGVVIKARAGKKVQSIASGKVIFSDWLQGYGLLVIVEHNKKYMSLYAFNQSLYKEKGDWINKGETIATVGNSGGRKWPGLYFEIRKKGKTVNPKSWLRRR